MNDNTSVRDGRSGCGPASPRDDPRAGWLRPPHLRAAIRRVWDSSRPPRSRSIILLWWVAFSRARWYERVGGIVLLVAAAFAEKFVVHPSIAGGAMGNMAYILVLTTLSVALVAWASVSRRLAPGARVAAAAAAVVLGCLPWTLLRTGGISGDGRADLHWRWSMTPEQQLLAQAGGDPRTAVPARSAPPVPAPAEPSTPA